MDALVGLLERFPEDKEALLNYICRCVASGKAVVAPNTALTLLEHLSTISQSKQHSFIHSIHYCDVKSTFQRMIVMNMLKQSKRNCFVELLRVLVLNCNLQESNLSIF